MTRYELLERIGAGRVAELFRGKAVAAGGFEKPVAIKRILPHLSQDPRFVEALIAEAKILSALRHRNIVQIFDVGLGDDGQHFLVMEFVEGLDLGALQSGIEARRQRMPIDLVLHIGAEVCEALDHAHVTEGPDGKPMRLVHRDVTPTNVLVSRHGEVKLTDFGLARRPGDGTHTGGLRGRFGYVSPEQATGAAVDGRSDVFAVGVITWELATGRRLFSGLADFDALRMVRESTIGRVRELVPDLPEDLDAILTEALARDPRQRLPSAGELGKRLRGLRYSLDSASGDPAAALARLVETTEGQRREAETRAQARGKAGGRRAKPTTGGFDATEPTIVRIRTADGFGHDADGSALVNARRVIDRFEEEETRLARPPRGLTEEVTVDEQSARRDSGEVTTAGPPMHLAPDIRQVSISPPPPAELHRGRAPDHRPRPAAPGARLDTLPATAAKGPPSSGRGVVPALPPLPSATPPASVTPVPSATPAPSITSRVREAPAERRTPEPGWSATPGPVFGGAAAPRPGTPVPRRTTPSVRRDLPAARSVTPPARAATPTTPQAFEPPATTPAPAPPVAGFGAGAARRWWPIFLGAAVIAVLSFAITRAVLDPPPLDRGATPVARDAGAAAAAAAPDAAPAIDAGAR